MAMIQTSRYFLQAATSHLTNRASCLSTSSAVAKECHRFVVAGGGTGGLSVASTLANWYPGQVAIIEPAKDHYYQPMFTLVGAGLKTLEEARRDEADLMPSNAEWIQEKVVEFRPNENIVVTSDDREIEYEYLIVALGLKLDFDKVIGLSDALGKEGVGCNYSPATVADTTRAIQQFQGGTALFTHPFGPVKCAGAPQKIMYLAEDYWRRTGIRDKSNIMMKLGTPFLFAAPKYRAALQEVCAKRGLSYDLHRNLICIDAGRKEATFLMLDDPQTPKRTETIKYDMIHVTPPMSPVDELVSSPLVDATGFVEVDQQTTQHKRFPNVFALGDCTNIPTSKTAAACAKQSKAVKMNLQAAIEGREPAFHYDGYTSCPLVTSHNTCIMAEFDFALAAKETFPFNQAQDSKLMYSLKADVLPEVYWNLMLKGYWAGPAAVRSLMHLGLVHD